MITFAAVVLARLIIPLFIPRFPLPAILAALLVDGTDRSIFDTFGPVDVPAYQGYDKALDIYYLTIAYAATIRNWVEGPAFFVGRVLWYYRLVGVVLFEYVDARWLLLVFANTFEYYFIAIETIKLARNPFVLGLRRVTMLAAFIWVCIKLPQEWWIHIAQLDVTDLVKQHLFGVGRDRSWLDAIGNRPSALVPLSMVAGGIVVVARAISRLLPPREWETTVSADVQGNHLGWPTPGRATVPAAFFGWSFVEKATLVTLVTLTFAQVLPDADTNILHVTVGVTVVITVSTLISQWLARHAMTWRSTAVQFVGLLGANIGFVVVAGFLVPGEGMRPPIPIFLFLMGLLTLIVVLFDRFRLIRRQHDRRSWRRGG